MKLFLQSVIEVISWYLDKLKTFITGMRLWPASNVIRFRLIRRCKLSENTLNRIIEKDKDRTFSWSIPCSQVLSEPFLIKHSAYLGYSNICKYQKISEAFIAKYLVGNNCLVWLRDNKNFSRERSDELYAKYN